MSSQVNSDQDWERYLGLDLLPDLTSAGDEDELVTDNDFPFLSEEVQFAVALQLVVAVLSDRGVHLDYRLELIQVVVLHGQCIREKSDVVLADFPELMVLTEQTSVLFPVECNLISVEGSLCDVPGFLEVLSYRFCPVVDRNDELCLIFLVFCHGELRVILAGRIWVIIFGFLIVEFGV